MKHYQKSEPAHHRSLFNFLFVFKFNAIWGILIWNNTYVTFWDKTKLLQKSKLSARKFTVQRDKIEIQYSYFYRVKIIYC